MTETPANGYSSESTHPMNTNMTGLRRFSKNLCILVLRAKVASALEGLRMYGLTGVFKTRKMDMILYSTMMYNIICVTQ